MECRRLQSGSWAGTVCWRGRNIASRTSHQRCWAGLAWPATCLYAAVRVYVCGPAMNVWECGVWATGKQRCGVSSRRHRQTTASCTTRTTGKAWTSRQSCDRESSAACHTILQHVRSTHHKPT